MFCKLTQGQSAALIFLKAMQSKSKTGTSKIAAKVALLVANQKWDALASIASLATPDGTATPAQGDFQ